MKQAANSTDIARNNFEKRTELQNANDLLHFIESKQKIVAHLAAKREAEIERVKASYDAEIAVFEAELTGLEKELKALMKMHKTSIFASGDIVYLSHGELVYSLTHPVAFPRSHAPLIALLESKGFADMVKVKKSADTDAIEKWDDEKLSAVGLKRKNCEEFKYNLKVG